MVETEEAPEPKSALISVSGLWRCESKKGKYLAGSNGNIRYFIFPNSKKKKDSEPDFQLCIAQRPVKSTDKNEKNEEIEI